MYLCLSCLTQRKVILDIPCCNLLFRLSVSACTLFLCIVCHYTNKFSFTSLGHLESHSASIRYLASSPRKLLLSLHIPPFFPILLFLLSSSPARLDIDDWTFSATVPGSDAFYSQMLTMGSTVPVLLTASPTLSSRSKACQAGTASMR